MNKIYRFIENSSKMTFPEKKDVFCKNNIVIVRNLEIKVKVKLVIIIMISYSYVY